MSKNALVEHQAHSREITDMYLDGQPYDRLRVVNETRFCLAQSAEQMLEAGRRLIVIKEHETHGEFLEIIEQQLGMNSRVTQRLMQAAAKFMSPKLQSKSTSLVHLGKSKLYELMLEDDDALAALDEGGTVAGLSLDDIDRMGCRELRKALREAREDAKAKDEVIADKNKKLDELATKKKRIKQLPPDEENAQIRAEAADHCFQAEALIRSQVREALNTVQKHAETNGLQVDSWLAGQIDQVEDALADLRQQLGVFRTVEGGLESWMVEETEEAEDAA